MPEGLKDIDPAQEMQRLFHTHNVLAEVSLERDRQEKKWGEQNHPLRFVLDDRLKYERLANFWKAENHRRVQVMNEEGATRDRNCAWDGILFEEVYEAFAEADEEKIEQELIQAAAVAVAIVESIRRKRAKRNA